MDQNSRCRPIPLNSSAGLGSQYIRRSDGRALPLPGLARSSLQSTERQASRRRLCCPSENAGLASGGGSRLTSTEYVIFRAEASVKEATADAICQFLALC